MNSEFYYKYYEFERKHWWFKVREKILMQEIDKRFTGKPFKILNVGCATGRTSEALHKFGEVVSIEYDKECCQFAKKQTGLSIINASILDLPFEDNTFDLVCAFDVIEHVEDHVLAVKEMVRVCKSQGNIFISVPAYMSLWSEHDEVNHHFRRYRLGEVEALFRPFKGNALSKTYFNTFLFPPIFVIRQLFKLLNPPHKKGKSDFETVDLNSPINRIPYIIFNMERYFLKAGVKFPFGVSIFYCWQKSDK